MPFVGTRSRRGIPPQFEATYAHDVHVAMALDARPTDVCLDCCEEARAEPLDCGGLRYTELLGECLCCGATDFAWVPVDFVGPTRRGDAPEPVHRGPTREEGLADAKEQIRRCEIRLRNRYPRGCRGCLDHRGWLECSQVHAAFFLEDWQHLKLEKELSEP